MIVARPDRHYGDDIMYFKGSVLIAASAWQSSSNSDSTTIRARFDRPTERSNEHRIKKFVRRHYDMTTRPVKSHWTQVKVMVAIALFHILDTVGRDWLQASNIAYLDFQCCGT